MNNGGSNHRTPLRINHGRITLVFYNRPSPCGGSCLYCIRQPGFTKSTISNEDTLLAKNCGWDARCQIDSRFRRYGLRHGLGNKYGFCVKGDSFTNHDPDYLVRYFKSLYDYLNNQESEDFLMARRLQRDAPDRCVWVQTETRPDQISEEWCERLAYLGVNTVELGVQCLDEKVLQINRRGHGMDEVITATRMLRDHGFDVGYHMMVGLPGGSDELDYEVLSERLWKDEFFPDCLKIYPCILMANRRLQTGLSRWQDRHDWQPLTDERYHELLLSALPNIPSTVHINRIQRIMATEDIKSGPREIVDRLAFRGISRCLWQRSLAQSGHPLHGDFGKYQVTSGPHGGGYSVEATVGKGEVLLGYGRLTAVRGVALVRDLRVLGDMVPVGASSMSNPQHRGIGAAMLNEMEVLAGKLNCESLRVLAPPGSYGYLEARGFQPDGEFHLTKAVQPAAAGKGT